jgi:hypothetical protein
MNAVEKKVLVRFVTLLNAFESFGDAFRALVQDNASMSAELHESLASEVATKYQCEFEMGTKGSYVFKNEDNSRHVAAGQFWYRNVGSFLKAPKVKSSKQVDVRARRADSIIRDEKSKKDVDKLVADIYAAWARKEAKKAAK